MLLVATLLHANAFPAACRVQSIIAVWLSISHCNMHYIPVRLLNGLDYACRLTGQAAFGQKLSSRQGHLIVALIYAAQQGATQQAEYLQTKVESAVLGLICAEAIDGLV